MSPSQRDLDQICAAAKDRVEIWSLFLNLINAQNVAEIGVWRGEFAEAMLRSCPRVKKYFMVDPWCHLTNWNKPANRSDSEFELIMAEALRRTDFAGGRRVILRGRSADVLDSIPDESLDFSYIDSDHSLRGITIDLLTILPKMKRGGWIGGDDFDPCVWQHGRKYEPTLVFPYAIYFAEAIGATIHAVGFNQFLMSVDRSSGTGPNNQVFIDRTGRYASTSVAAALRCAAPWRAALRRTAHGSLRRRITGVPTDRPVNMPS